MLKKFFKRILYIVAVLFVFLNIVCIFHAYKFTHFYDDAEPLKAPEEMTFDDKLTAALFGVRYNKLKSIDTFSISHQTIKLNTTNNLQLDAWYAKANQNDSVKSKGTVILFHGHASHKNAIVREASAFLNIGYNIMLVDFRAHGNSEGNICTIGYNESKDVKAAYDFIKNKGEKNIILYGISLGASTIIKAVATDSIKPNKIIAEMPFGTLYKAVNGRVKMMGLPTEPFSSLLTFWGGTQQGFWAFGFKPEEYAKKIECPILVQWGTKDARVTKQEVINIFNNAKNPKKMFIEYKGSGHQSLCKNENQKWLYTIELFLK